MLQKPVIVMTSRRPQPRDRVIKGTRCELPDIEGHLRRGAYGI